MPLWSALVIVVVGAGLGTAVAALHSGSPGSRSPAAAQVTPARSQPRPAPGPPGFRSVYGASVPISAAGPHHVEADGEVSGFDHSPAGALEAAASLTYAASPLQPIGTIEATVADQVVGADRAAFLSQITGQQAADKTSTAAQVASAEADGLGVYAWNVASYTPSAATVDLLVRVNPSGGAIYVNFATQVQWLDGDWRLVAPPGGTWASVASTQISVPAGFSVIGSTQ